MSKLELKPVLLLGVLAALGLLINLVILATGGASSGDTSTDTPPVQVNKGRQRATLNAVNAEIEQLRASQIVPVTEAQENAFNLFVLAQDNGVEVRSLVNNPPEEEALGRINVKKLVSNLEIRGRRSDVIDMLLDLDERMPLTDVGVVGTPEDWVIQFALTQYLGPS